MELYREGQAADPRRAERLCEHPGWCGMPCLCKGTKKEDDDEVEDAVADGNHSSKHSDSELSESEIGPHNYLRYKRMSEIEQKLARRRYRDILSEPKQEEQSADDQGGPAASAADFTVEDKLEEARRYSHSRQLSDDDIFTSANQFDVVNDEESEEPEPLIESCDSDDQLSIADSN